MRLRASRVAAALIAALCSLPAFAFGSRSCEKLKTHGLSVKLEIERVATPQPAAFTGVVGDESGNPIPGVTIAVRDEASARELTVVTDVNGAFTITSLSEGLYRIEVTLAGFKTTKLEHLQLKASEVTHASVALRPDVTDTITVGAIAPDLMMMEGGTGVRLSHDFISKLPI
jgi:hypothetical protein